MSKIKGGVKFQDQPNKELVPMSSSVPISQKTTHLSLAEQKELALSNFNKVQSQLKQYTAQDPECQRKDTAFALKSLLEKLKATITVLNDAEFDEKVNNYYLLYNATIYVFEICRILRKSVYQSVTIEFIAFSIASIEGNIQLMSVKYLDWRVKLYIELAQVYFSLGSVACALRTIESILTKVQELRDIEEMDPPLPDYIDRSLTSNQRNLRILELKFRVQSGLAIDQWKKRLEEYFTNDPEGKCTAIIECLRQNPPPLSNTQKQTAQITPVASKEQVEEQQQIKFMQLKNDLLTASYEILRLDMERITKGLEQTMEKITQQVEFKASVLDSYGHQDEDQQQKRADLTKQRRDFEATLIKEKDWRRSGIAFPLQYQVEFAQHAYDCGNMKIFDEVSNSAHIRCKFRRLEVPYIVDIDFKVSATPNPNIPNGYEKIAVDLNEASLRQELRKLRNKSRQGQEPTENNKKDDKKETKKDKPQVTNTNQNNQDQVGMGVQASESELSQINHTYVFLIYKTSMIPENAVYEIDMILADEEEGPTNKLAEGYRAIAVPVKQYTGVRETTKNIPYLLVRHTRSALQNEHERLTLITGVRPLFGKNPLIRAVSGYEKLALEIRQTPPEFIRSPNMDYLFLTFSIEKHFVINERELQVMMKFSALERSYHRDKSLSLDDDARFELDLCYNVELLSGLSQTLGTCLQGPLGDRFQRERRDQLYQLVFVVWRKYLQSQLYQLEFMQELRITKEIHDQDYERYLPLVNQAKQIFSDILLVINSFLFSLPQVDIVFLIKINLSLAKLLEESGQNALSVINLNDCLQRVAQYRNNLLARGVDSKRDCFLPFSLTCSARKMKLMTQAMKESYVATKNQINREIRLRQRNKPLDADEVDEEEFELLESQQNYLGDDNGDQAYFNHMDAEITAFQNDNLTKLINSLHADLIITAYRCQVKAGRKSVNVEVQDRHGIATSIIKKMSIDKGPTASTIRKNLNQLQTTLQKEGKINPPNPHILDFEKVLIDQANNNNYAKCLLYIVLATNKNKATEQKTLLEKSLDFLRAAERDEEQLIENGIKDSIYVLSTQLDNLEQESHAEDSFPFSMLYNQDFIKATQVPRKPILLCRTSQSVTLKLPPFKPKLLDVIGIDEAKKTISSMGVFGKVSANGVNVSLTCTDLPNTGTRQRVGGVVHITNLEPNQKYCFASAGYDGNEAVANGIGVTGDDIAMVHTLPLPLLASYLAKIAYQQSHFQLAEQAASLCIQAFTEDSEIQDPILGNQLNPLYFKRLIQERLREVGLIEINNLAETFLIQAKCMGKKLQLDQDDPKSAPAHWQKQTLRIANYFLLGMEASLCTRNYFLAKRLIGEAYNILERFLCLHQQPLQVFHLLLKMQMVILEVPKQFWDANLRILSAKCSFEVLKASMQLNEITLGKRVLYSQLRAFNRKWYQVPKLIMVEEVREQVGGAIAAKKDTKKDPKRPVQTTEEIVPLKMVPKLIREMFESASTLQDYLEETILSMHEEFGESVPQFVERWRESIDQIAPFVENSADQLDRAFSDLSVRLEYWEYLRDVGTAFTKVQQSFKGSPLYMEVLCKLFRRMLETPGLDIKTIYDSIQSVGEIASTDSIKLSVDIRELMLNAISNDIEFYPASLQFLKHDLETSKQGNPQAIKIFEQFYEKQANLQTILHEDHHVSQMGSLNILSQRFDYIQLWKSEYESIKAIVSYQLYKKNFKTIRQVQTDQFCNVTCMDLTRTTQMINEFVLSEEIRQEKAKLEQQAVVSIAAPVQQQGKGAPIPVAKGQQPQVVKEVISEESALQTMLEQTFKYIANACHSALQAREYALLINEVRFLYNLLVYEQVSPFMHKGTECWKYLALCSLSIIKMLKQVRKDGGVHQSRKDRNSTLQIYPHLIEKLQKSQTVVSFVLDVEIKEPDLPVLETTLSKDFWFTSIKDLEIDLIANFICYVSQTLLIENKYQTLIGITREFCNATTHYYSLYVLPFTVYAQQFLLGVAQPKRIERQQALETRTAEFRNWELTKKRKTRSSILTQEVAPEEVQYEKDRGNLEGQIALLIANENFIQHELEHSEKLISEIQRDANQAIEGLKQARKLYEKYAVDDRALEIEVELAEFGNEVGLLRQFLQGDGDKLLQRKGTNLDGNYLKQRRKNHKQLGMQIISRYKLVIEVLRKRQEKFQLTLALRELGNLNLAMENPSLAEEMWSDSIDTIFQRIYTLKNSTFRKMLSESKQPLALTYGVTQCLIGLNITSTLAHYSYQSNCHQQRESCTFASELVYSVFRMQMPNPMSWAAFLNSSVCDISCSFTDRFTLDCAETALSCERMSWMLLDRDESLRALPLLSLLRHLSQQMSSQFYGVRAMLMRLVALAHIGAIDEAYQLLVKVASEKDLPLFPGNRPSLFQSKTSGQYWYNQSQWQNGIPPYEERHFAMTETILKEMQLTRAFGLKYGLLNENLYNYALAYLLYNTYSADIVEKWEMNDQRAKILHRVEAQIRLTIKKVGFEEELDNMVYQAITEQEILKQQGDESGAQEIMQKKKDEIFIYARQFGNIQDINELESLYQLLRNGQPIGISNNEEGLKYFQRREERLHMIARMRLLLAKVNISLGLTTRALWIVKNAIENIAKYVLEERRVELGEETQNSTPIDQLKPQGMEEKKGVKAPGNVKDDKKPQKGGKGPEVSKEDEAQRLSEEKQRKLAQTAIDAQQKIVTVRKYKRNMNVFWWIRMRVEFLMILQRHNRNQEANDLIEQLKPELQQFNETYYQRVVTEIEARILVKQGKFDEAIKKFEEALSIAKMYQQNDPGLCALMGDYGELLRERGHFSEGLSLFQECQKLAEFQLKQVNFGFGSLNNLNSRATQEKIEIALELQISKEAEDDIIKRGDKQGGKSSKKEEKKKDDSKGAKRGPSDKGQAKSQPSLDRPQMKIQLLNPLVPLKTQSLSYSVIDGDQQNASDSPNCYFKYVELWIRSALRLVDTQIQMQPMGEEQSSEQNSISDKEMDYENQSQKNSIQSVDSKSSNQIYEEKEILDLLSKVEASMRSCYNVPVSFRVELYYLQAQVYKRSFIQILQTLQNKFFDKYQMEKIKKYRKFWEKSPYRDLVRHRYFLGVPGYSQQLKEQGFNRINKSKEILMKAINIIRGEAVLYEHFRKPEDILYEISEVCLLQREYRPRLTHKYVDIGSLQKIIDSKITESQPLDIQSQLQKQERSDKLEQLNLELESTSYLKYANEFVSARQQLCEQPHAVGLQPLIVDVSKMPLDIYTEIIEQDYIYKKNYAPILFDDSKKKSGVGGIDLLIFMQKIWRESRLMTFSQSHLQRLITKTHRFLRIALTNYQKCMLNSIEVAPKADINAVFVDEGQIVARSTPIRINNEHKFIYILGPLNKDKLIIPHSKVTKEERDKILINDEKDVLYGTIYVTDVNLDNLLQDCFNLKSKMQESDLKQTKAMERNYKIHKEEFHKLIEQLGQYFFQKKNGVKSKDKKSLLNNDTENFEIDLIDKYTPFIPDLTHDNIDFLINFFNETGVQVINHFYLVILRYFHNNKYK